MRENLLFDEWDHLFQRVKETGSPNEKIMASMLKDILNGAVPGHVFDAWASVFLDRAA